MINSLKVFDKILQFPKTAIGVVLVLTILAGLQLPNLKIHTDLKALIPHDDVFDEDQQVTDTFALKEVLIVGVVFPPDALDESLLGYLETMSLDIDSIEGVYQVRSVFSEDNIKDVDGSIDIGPFIQEVSPETAGKLAREIDSFPAVQGLLAAKDLSCLSLLVELENGVDKNGIYDNINQLLIAFQPPDGVEFYMSGMPVFEGVLGVHILQDLILLLPLLAIILALFLYLSYRSWLLVIVSLLEIAVVDIWTLGFMSFVGAPLYLIHAIMPVILMALVVADEIHIFGKYFELADISDRRKRILTTMQTMWLPVVLTSITTSLGFLSFLSTSMKPLQYFGIFTAFGIFAAMFFSLLLTPILMNIRRASPAFRQPVRLEKKLAQLGDFLFAHQKTVLLGTFLLLLVSLFGASKLYIQDSWIGNFKEKSRVTLANTILNKKMAGTRLIQIELDTGKPGGVKQGRFLEQLNTLQMEIEKLDKVGKTLSPAQVIAKMHKEFSGEYGIPTGDLVAQYFLLLEGSTHDNLWDMEYRKARLTVYSRRGDFVFADDLIAEIEQLLHRHLPAVKYTLAGDLALSHHWVSLLAKDQAFSLLTAFILIFGAAAILLRSLKKGAVVIIPIMLAVAVNFACMGFTNIPISVATSMFSSIIFGVGIDYVIHLQSAFDSHRKNLSIQDAMRQTFSTVGVAVCFDGIIVIAGFLVLLLSNQPPNQMLGIMVSLGVASSVVISFLVLPLFWCISGVEIKFSNIEHNNVTTE